MKTFTLFVAFLFALVVIADEAADSYQKHHHHHHHHHGHKKDPREKECKELFALEHLEFLAGNATLLAKETHNNATKIGEIQAKASADAGRLADLQRNTTLVKDCEILAAAEEVEKLCQEIAELEEFIAFAENSTDLAIKVSNNATRISQIQTQASQDSTTLQQFQRNQTLISICVVIFAHKDEERKCRKIHDLENFLSFADNSTAVAEKTGNNYTEIAEIQSKAQKDAAILTQLKSNATLVADCLAFDTVAAPAATATGLTGGTQAGTKSGNGTTNNKSSSGADARFSGTMGMTSFIVAAVAAVAML